jgi:D-glycero-D-manno-heptose 1,7-bisphosphate phosphatase
MSRAAVFLDRDGVLVPDVDLARSAGELRPYPWTAESLRRLGEAGFARVVVTNQTVIARGLASAADVERLHGALGLEVERYYVCPHHPSATLREYRLECDCRKPRPGLLLRAARELELDLARSFMVGDRPSDVLAGRRAGCRTIRVCSGAHAAPPIESPDPIDPEVQADHSCADLRAAVEYILEARG